MKLGFYPDVVNENATRIVALTVIALGLISLLIPNWISLAILLFGFVARVTYGPKFEPFAWITAHWIVPKLGVSFLPTAGPPKRFAQLIGFFFASASIVLFYLDIPFAYSAVLSTLVFFASLEAFLGFCAGCFAFRLLMKAGLIPEEVCERCNNLNFDKAPTS